MNIILFLISVFFSFIFYFFYKISNSQEEFLDGAQRIYPKFIDSLSGNLFIESLIFLLLGFFFLIIFSSFTNNGNIEKIGNIKNFFKNNFKKILYYLGFMLFYISIWMIFGDLNFNFSYVIFIINLLILIAFFVSRNFFILADLLKINTVIFSSIYIFLYIKLFIVGNNSFLAIDFINSLLILLSFFISIYSDKFLQKNSKNDSFFTTNFFIYSYLFLVFYSFLIYDNLIFLLSVYSFLFSFFIFYYLVKLKIFKSNLLNIKVIGIIFSYFSIIFGLYYLLKISFNPITFPILAYLSYFNFQIHKKYENYLSFFFFLFTTYFLIFYTYFKVIFYIFPNNTYFTIFSFIIVLLSVIFSYFYKFKRIYDYYFLYLFGIIINIFVTFYFFYKNDFNFFNLGVILFYFSVYVFLSYYKIKKLEEKNKK